MSVNMLSSVNFSASWLNQYEDRTNHSSYENIGVCLKLDELKEKWPFWKSQFLTKSQKISTSILLAAMEDVCASAVDAYNVKRLGVYLSGGLDSAVLVLIAQRLGVDVLAITGSVLGDKSPEIESAKKVAQQLNCSHVSYGMKPSDMSIFPDFIQSFTSPVDEVPPFVLWLANKRLDIDCDLILCGQNLDTVAGSMGYHGKCFLNMSVGNKSAAIDYSYKHKSKTNDFTPAASLFNDYPISNIRELFLFEYLVGESPRNWISFIKSGINQPVLFPYAQPQMTRLLLNMPLYQRIFPVKSKADLYVWQKPFLHKLAKDLGLSGNFRRKSFAHPYSIYSDHTYNLMNTYIERYAPEARQHPTCLQISRDFIEQLWINRSGDLIAEDYLSNIIDSMTADIREYQSG